MLLVVILVIVVMTFGLAGSGLMFRRRKPLEQRDVDADLPDVRDRRIAELEARLSRPAALGVSPISAGLSLAVCLAALWVVSDDAEYFFSARTPIQLGAEGDYRFDAARDNRYVELHGVPTSRGAFGIDGRDTVVAVGVRDTPVMVWRRALKGEEWMPGSKPPPPNQQSFTIRGRLRARTADADKYTDAFKKLDEFGEVKPKWVLIESERPGGNFTVAILTTLLSAVAGFMAWLLVRGLLAMRKVSRRGA